MIIRLIAERLKRWQKSILLLGPRQVGKSTLIRSLSSDLEINLADQDEFLTFSGHAGELRQRINHRQPSTVFIDEVQRLPSLLNTVQALIDDDAHRGKLKFYLTGSSARKLRRGEANLLPGRIFTYHLGPVAACELDYRVDSQKMLEMGCLPEPYSSTEDRSFQEKLLLSYASTYVKEEIQAEAEIRNLEGFSRFLFVSAENSGKFLDLSKVATKAKVSRSMAVRFFEILEDTLIAKKIMPCPFLTSQNLVKHPRYYFFDTGVLNGLLKNFTASPDRKGLLFEHLFFNQLNQSAWAKDVELEISTFRTRGGLEVDFVVRMDNNVWAIELKSSSHVTSADVAALQNFRSHYCADAKLLVATLENSHPKKQDHISILPWPLVLKEMGL